MADDVKGLILQVSASTELLRSNLIQAENAIAQFERDAKQRVDDIDNRFGQMGAPLQKFDQRLRQVTVSAAQQRAGMQQLGFQISDVGAQLASGTNALTIFAQQSGQVVQAIALMRGSSGGLIGFLSGPWGAALTAAIALLGNLAFAHFRAGDAADAQKKSLDQLKQSMDRIARGQGTPQDQSDLFLKRAQTQAELDRVRSRLAAETPNRPLPGELRNVLRRRAQELEGKVANADALLRAAELQQRAREKLDALNGPDRGSTGGRSSGGGGSSRRIGGTSLPKESLADKLGFDQQIEELRRRSTDAAPYGQNIQDIIDKFSQPLDLKLNYDDALSEYLEGRQRTEDEAARLAEDKVRSLAGFYEDIFSGRTDDIWKNFKQKGLQVIAEVLAKFTLSRIGGGGGGFDLGTAFSTALSSVFGGGFADGGGPPVGKVSLVGERGPELFVPRVPGTIIPNHMLRSGNDNGRSISVTVNQNWTFDSSAVTPEQLVRAQIATKNQTIAEFRDLRARGAL